MTANPAGPGPVGRRGGRRTVMRVVPGSISWPPGRWQPPGPSPRPALPCCGLLARSASPVFARGLLTGSPDPALLTTSLALAGACNDNDRMVLQARSSDRGARPGRLKWTRRRRHSRNRGTYARRILTICLVECVGGTGPRPGILGVCERACLGRNTRERRGADGGLSPYDRVFGRPGWVGL